MQTVTVPLSVPLAFGDRTIPELTLRRPSGGDLRGLKLSELMALDVNTIGAVVLRTTLTPIPKALLNDLDPADIVDIGVAVLGFFEASLPSQTTPSKPGA